MHAHPVLAARPWPWLALLQVCGWGWPALSLYPQGLPSPSPLWHGLRPGPHRVGVRVLNLVEPSLRSSDRRVVRVVLWYPAVAGSEPVIPLGAYLDLKPDTVPDPSIEAWLTGRDRESLGRQFFDADAPARHRALLQAPTAAVAGARAAEGRFPLVLHSLGRNGGQFQHTVLWEYLASHGFAVASVAQFGRDVARPAMDFSFEDLAIQRDDMRRALEALSRLPAIDSTRVGAIGHSSGAIIALWLAAGRPRIGAVVGLDGSINPIEGRDLYRRGLAGRVVTAPLLNICRWPHDEYVEYASRQHRGQLLRIGYQRAVHFDFQNWPAYLAFANSTEPSSARFRTVAEARRVFESTAEFTRLFLQAHLSHDPSAQATVTSAERVAELSSGLATLLVMSR